MTRCGRCQGPFDGFGAHGGPEQTDVICAACWTLWRELTSSRALWLAFRDRALGFDRELEQLRLELGAGVVRVTPYGEVVVLIRSAG